MGGSAGKRRREQERLEKTSAKVARRAIDAVPAGPLSQLSESELIEDLGALHRALETGNITLEDFEERRDRLHAQFEQFYR
jgi:hypothetical protein